MAPPSNTTGKRPSASGSTSSPRPKQGTSFVPRPLTPSEIEWLRREGREFQEQYGQIKADLEKRRAGQDAMSGGDAEALTAVVSTPAVRRGSLEALHAAVSWEPPPEDDEPDWSPVDIEPVDLRDVEVAPEPST